MRWPFYARLYLRFYLALLACLLLFAGVTAALWHRSDGPLERANHLIGRLLQNSLPPADAPAAQQQAGLEALAEGLSQAACLCDEQGRLLARVGRERDPNRPQPCADGRRGWARIQLPDGRWLAARMSLVAGPGGLHLHQVLLLLALLIGVAAFPLVRQITRRLERLQRGVERLGAGDWAARVPVQGHDEVARLAESFNRSAGRIEQLVGAHKSLLAHASHELRTPLTRIQLALTLAGDGLDTRRRAGLERDIAELDQLIDEILWASRLDAVTETLQRERIDLLALAAEVAAGFTDVELAGEVVELAGDARLLRRLLRNLLENAERHGAPPTRLQLQASDGWARLSVKDGGPGVPEADLERVFEPFYRASSQGPGSGLGLALVRQIAQRHGGTVRCLRVAEGGNAFVVSLPLAAGERA